MVVSHDYDFLTKVCTDIVHFENQKLTVFDGGFPGFRAKKPNLVLPRMKKETLDAISKHAEENGLDVDDGSNDGMRGDASSLDKSKELARREALGLENTAGLVSAMNKGAMTIGGSNGINKNKMNGCGGENKARAKNLYWSFQIQALWMVLKIAAKSSCDSTTSHSNTTAARRTS